MQNANPTKIKLNVTNINTPIYKPPYLNKLIYLCKALPPGKGGIFVNYFYK